MCTHPISFASVLYFLSLRRVYSPPFFFISLFFSSPKILLTLFHFHQFFSLKCVLALFHLHQSCILFLFTKRTQLLSFSYLFFSYPKIVPTLSHFHQFFSPKCVLTPFIFVGLVFFPLCTHQFSFLQSIFFSFLKAYSLHFNSMNLFLLQKCTRHV